MAIYNNKQTKVPYTMYLKLNNVNWLKEKYKKKVSIEIDRIIDIMQKMESDQNEVQRFLEIKKSWDWEKQQEFENLIRKKYQEHYLKISQNPKEIELDISDRARFYFKYYEKLQEDKNDK